jgi:hypothetical protein
MAMPAAIRTGPQNLSTTGRGVALGAVPEQTSLKNLSRQMERGSRKERNMNENNRVLSRRGARVLSPEEMERVSGSLPTDTVCTWDPKQGAADGDSFIGEC